MRFYVNRALVPGPWGGGNLWVKAAYSHIPSLGHEVLDPGDFKARPEVILLAGIDGDGVGISAEQAIMYKMYMGNCKLIARINENDARKGTDHVDDNLLKLSGYVDGTVFVSNWLQDYFMEKGWQCPNNTVIYNGVDQEIFKPNDKLNNGKVNIVTHHWSNNRMKGFDVYDLLDEFVGKSPDFTFTYIGRENGTFKNSQVIKPLFGPALGKELGKYDVYVSASRFDPGPNHVLESLACQIPTYVHEDGGGSVEFAGSSHAFSNWDELRLILTSKKFENNQAMTLLDWNTCITKYVRFAEGLQ